ncbi:unnamed protein product [Didymodactylos carnosus]|uniref:Uncharacterized protein n=1 Tax=Didymodactylos carnosus TaxID=1234261 RepID=A0A8S2FJW8_9BILA|nr:unnamed protein product [Didymodactylos carnosus]CAF4279270.1 unnamed protein product [Didymodactylos carnosus]
MAENVEIDYYSKVRPYWDNDRDIGTFSDHLTVWLDLFIGRPEESIRLKAIFQRFIQPLNTLDQEEEAYDNPMTLLEDPRILEELKDRVYCLKPFFEVDACLAFIRENDGKKIFFISSGTMGEKIVPQIADLPQIHGIYIFCGNISYHAQGWAGNYVEHISAMLDHQDNLLIRMTKDISAYLEDKGDHYMKLLETFKAKTCYAWGIKLSMRQEKWGGRCYQEPRARLMNKFIIADTSYEDDHP